MLGRTGWTVTDRQSFPARAARAGPELRQHSSKPAQSRRRAKAPQESLRKRAKGEPGRLAPAPSSANTARSREKSALAPLRENLLRESQGGPELRRGRAELGAAPEPRPVT